MEIKIPLPQNSSANTFQDLMAYLKQLELAVHHAQKSVESAEKNGVVITEDTSIWFGHPSFDNKEKIEEQSMLDFTSNYFDELQNIELIINLV